MKFYWYVRWCVVNDRLSISLLVPEENQFKKWVWFGILNHTLDEMKQTTTKIWYVKFSWSYEKLIELKANTFDGKFQQIAIQFEIKLYKNKKTNRIQNIKKKLEQRKLCGEVNNKKNIIETNIKYNDKICGQRQW